MTIKNLIIGGLIGGLFVSLSACGKKDADKEAEAQACLDKSTSATAMNCVSYVSGLNTKAANVIRCSAPFIAEGIAEPSELADAFQNLEGSNNSTAFLNVLAFNSKSTSADNKAFAEETFNYCKAAGNPGFVLIAGYSNMATAIAAVASVNIADGNLTQDEVDAIVAAGPDAIAATATAVYQTSCTSGNESNAQLCTELGTAISGSSDNTELANALLTAWRQ